MIGYLVIADLTGYTLFLTGSELEHAQDILNTLMGDLTGELAQGLHVSKLEGDAVLAYAPDGGIQNGQTMLDLVESIYVSFRKLRENMQLSTTCTCRACANIGGLDLKFFVHHGEFLLADIAGREELSGPAVILVHRLLKNECARQAGLSAYAMFTDQALQVLGMPEFGAGLAHAGETYEHLGRVGVALHDLHPVWERDRSKRDCFVRREDAALVVEYQLPVSPVVAWDIITNPATRAQFMGAVSMQVTETRGGRIQAGATYHCAHGDGETPQFIMDWQPVQYLTTRDTVLRMMGGSISTLITIWLSPESGGTHVTVAVDKPKVDKPWMEPLVRVLWRASMRGEFEKTFKQKVATHLAALARERSGV